MCIDPVRAVPLPYNQTASHIGYSTILLNRHQSKCRLVFAEKPHSYYPPALTSGNTAALRVFKEQTCTPNRKNRVWGRKRVLTLISSSMQAKRDANQVIFSRRQSSLVDKPFAIHCWIKSKTTKLCWTSITWTRWLAVRAQKARRKLGAQTETFH